ncbi:MAG: oligopeptidase A [Woeseiaceae bacterium]|jgi:oligopeptidase A|tara:strand:- start:22170 stop:24179 length:2010 start_codon:yes stop_codon:yes gene_type:complete
MTQSNSYKSTLPDFSSLTAKEAQTNLKSLVKKQRMAIDKLLKNKQKITFESVVNPIEEMQHELSRTFSPISHLQNVLDQPEWRSTYNSCLPLLTDYGTELSQNTELEKAYKTIIDNLDDQKDPKFKLLEQELRNFTLNGVNLTKTKKQKFKDLKTRLSTAEANFSQNVQDSTDAWSLHINNEDELKGISREILEQAKDNQDRWKLILDYPTYHSVMTHAENRSLRERFYKAWSTRASDQAEDTQWNNEENIKNILSLRHQLANIVGYKNFAEYSLATKMANSTNEIIDFLDDLAKKTKSTARNELTILEKAADHNLEAWDISYYLEKTKQQNYAISDEELKQYLPKENVQKGMFNVAKTLYAISLRKNSTVPVWHDSVEFIEVIDSKDHIIGGFYIDLFARNGKRSGAWMDECVIKKNLNGNKALPIGYLVCNFTPPDKNGISLLTHDDVVTWFHEFGHMLHHLLTKIGLPSISGINGVPWDAVELPSQFMENFAWNYEVLKDCSKHHKTEKYLPKELFSKLQASRNFGAGLAMLRQIEFALYDMTIHSAYDIKKNDNTLRTLESVRKKITLIKTPSYNRFPMSFSHIFSGGYAAGYYSYKWAEVLAADAFSAFEDSHILNKELANKFKREILEIGGSKDIMQGFINFRGRKPSLEPLLKQCGIAGASR